MKKVIANVVYPIYSVTVLVADNATEEEIEEAICARADYFMENSGCEPIVQDLEVSNKLTAKEVKQVKKLIGE